mmetsp:Transcript_32224/g.52563  ORF Transcript_32224/g.52563 Transcript_32224/m.52563 type:complete len:96 (+) Transcript_32224:69-356(+)|eukprot:CAMPEP_0201954928 /NCGR_PEP_ID=MMETSP0904-20121228/2724_1 /ASSEMBLY_ACC=CAM_ASM_000553 /TAXON_ID=420261 /ORGANISM="Thalassiosira antarctica, Strain CCMP982" /LENGTH=95 /DNA_ID=CAMNT_0048499027 /DNA_START=69 /DNA_END=356 /DNA_ORIENTATION=+
MTLDLRLEKLKQIHTDKKRDIIRVAATPGIPLRRKQLLYACLNNLCQLSARLFGEISNNPGNHDLLEDAAELDASLLALRKQVGSLIPTRTRQAA